MAVDTRLVLIRSRAGGPVDSDVIRRLLGTVLAQDDPYYLKYSVPRRELLERLRNFDNRLIIINAARGSGKSGLLINHKEEIRTLYQQDIVIHKANTDISFPPDSTEVNQYVAFWKNTLLGWVVSEIGKRKGFAFADSEMSAVEIAEKLGEKERNIVGALLKRIKFKHLPFEKLEYDPEITDGLFTRLCSDFSPRFWLLLDEMDEDYTAAKSTCLVALMQATKHITQRHKNISIRLTIRPHIMTILRETHDVIQRFNADEIEISWKEGQLEDLLARRVTVFEGLDEARQLSLTLSEPFPARKDEIRRGLIGKFFEDFDASFVEGKESNFRALYTLSFYRPRWLIEYCGLALSLAEGDKATRTDFNLALERFATKLVHDLCGEHNVQIPQLKAITNQIIGARKVSFGNSNDLRRLIIEKVIMSGVVPVTMTAANDAMSDIATKLSRVALDIANSLYMIDFIRPRQSVGGRDDHRFYRFQERPSLLSSWSNEPNITWQLHPTFARGLNVQDSGVYRVHGEVREFGKKGRERHRRQL